MATVSVGEALKEMPTPDAKMVKRLLEQGMMIPAQPRVLEELRKHLQKKVFDVRVLSRVINGDPGMVALLFKACNSAAYRRHQPFDSVEAILHSVGVRQTFNLVQAIALASLQDTKNNREAYESFWARSHAIGQLAMLVADDRITVCNIFPDQAYLAGMFHDCGVALLMRRFPTYCAEMRLNEPGGWIELAEEDKKFNADHCVVGYLVGRHWNLPEFICDAIRYHHEFSRMGQHASRSMVAILLIAIHLYYRDQGVSNPEWATVKDDVLGELGMHDDALPEFSDVLLEQFHSQES